MRPGEAAYASLRCVPAGKILGALFAQVVTALQAAGASAVSIHGRTQQQRYSRPADWDLISSVAAARDVPVIGNGENLQISHCTSSRPADAITRSR